MAAAEAMLEIIDAGPVNKTPPDRSSGTGRGKVSVVELVVVAIVEVVVTVVID